MIADTPLPHNYTLLLQRYTTQATTCPPHSELIAEASLALANFSKHPLFPEVALHILLHASLTNEELSLTTNLLKNKFKFDFELLDRSQLTLYYEGLLRVTQQVHSSSRSSFRAICEALALIYVNIVAQEPLSVCKYLQPLLEQGGKSEWLYDYYFRTMEEVASSLNNTRVVLDDSHRSQARERVESQQLEVLGLLEEGSERVWSRPEVDKDTIMECLTCWAELNGQALQLLPSLKVMHRLMEAACSECQSESATVCLSEIIGMLHHRNANIKAEVLEAEAPLFDYIGSHLLALCEQADQLLADSQPQEAEVYVLMVLEWAGKTAPQLINPASPTHALLLLTKLANYTVNAPSQGAYGQLMDFWEELVEEGVRLGRELVMHPAIDLIDRVYGVVCSKCEYAPEEVELIDRGEDLKKHCRLAVKGEARTFSAEFFDRMARIKGHPQYVDFVVAHFKDCWQDGGINWQKFESHLFSLAGPCKRLTQVTDSALMLVNTFQNITADAQFSPPVIVRKTYLRVLGSLLSVPRSEAEFVKKMFYLVSASFGTTKALTLEAERAFCKGCEANAAIMCDKADQVVELVHRYPSHETIAKGVTTLVCAHQPNLITYLPQVLECLLVLGEKNEEPHDRKHSLSGLIDAFRVFRGLAPSPHHLQILSSFTSRGWEFFTHCLAHPENLMDDEDKLVEMTAKLLKLMLRVMGDSFRPFIEPLYSTVLGAFELYPVCSYVYLLEVLVTCYGGREEFKQYIGFIYGRFFDLAMGHLQGVGDIEHYSLLIDDFIGMHKRILIYNASILLESGRLPQTLDIAHRLMECPNPRIMAAVHSFFETLFMVYWPSCFVDEYNSELQTDQKVLVHPQSLQLRQQFKPCLLERTQFIICRMLELLSTAPPQGTTEYILDTLLAQVKAFPDQNQAIWGKVLEELPQNVLLSTEKERFMGLLTSPGRDPANNGRAVSTLRKLLFTINRRLVTTVKRNELSKFV